ncbi:hypothetical protein [Mesorhizobium sp. M0909]|uniref:hypothetical protein n=1 Tax=Mesorhizobium sp. M0909 TaxID=2957024 RepID=UPI003335749A
MSARAEFWRDPRRWPVNVPGFVFAARAVTEVGKAVYGEAWTGAEPISNDPFNFPRIPLLGGKLGRLTQSSAKPWQKESINSLLRKHRPEFGRTPVEYRAYGPKPLVFSEDEWSAGLDLAEQADESLTALRARFDGAVAHIVRACAEGELVSALRPKEGGKMSDPLPAHMWHTERAAVRFDWGQMNPHKPFDSGVGGDAYQFVYFGRESLDRLKASISKAGTRPAQQPNEVSGSKAKAFEREFRRIVDASPTRRTHSKEALYKLAHQVSKREVDRIRGLVLDDYPEETMRAWRGAGRSAQEIDAG